MRVHEYRPGTWIALLSDGAVALLHPSVGPAVAGELWELARSGSRLGAWVEYLAGGGIRALPSFAMVEARPEGLGVLVRGDLQVQVGDRLLSGSGYATWKEELLPGAAGFRIIAHGGRAGAEELWLPAQGGIVYAGELRSSGEGAHAGLVLAEHDEEDLELTLMRAPALAAAGRGGAAPGTEPERSPGTEPERAPGTAEWAAGTEEAAPLTPPGLDVTQIPEDDDDPARDGSDDPAAPRATTLISSVPGRPAPAEDSGDHDGRTMLPEQLRAARGSPAPTAGRSPAPAAGPEPVAPAAPVLELAMSTGPRIEVDRPVLLGRAPEAGRFRGNAVPRLVTVPNPDRDISATHVEVRPAGDHVVVTDMNSTNGTVLQLPGQPAFRIHPGSGVPVPSGATIELGTGVTLTVERPGQHDS